MSENMNENMNEKNPFTVNSNSMQNDASSNNGAKENNYSTYDYGQNKTNDSKKSEKLNRKERRAKAKEEKKAAKMAKKAQKKGHPILRAAAVVGLAAVFGVCAGAGVYGAQYFSSTSIVSESSDDSSSDSSTTNTISVSTTSSDSSVVATDVTAVVESAMPSIVSIDCTFSTTSTDMFGQTTEEESSGSGSGIIIAETDTELIIVTNNHVIEDATTMTVTFNDGSSATAYLKGTDSSVDIGVIAVELEDLSEDTLNSISIATLGDSDSLTVGETAIAIGNALGYGQSVTTGVISALNREIETEDGETNTFIQTDAAINPGNSGGALLNSKGEVIGVTSSKIGATTVEGMGFAIPISDVIDLINELMNEDTKITVSEEEKGALGVSVMTPTGIEGAYVASVTEGSAADNAGIEVGDLITAFDGNTITSASDLTSLMSYYSEGDTVTVTVLRKVDGQYESLDLEVTLDNASTLTATTSSNSSESSEDSDAESNEENSDSENNSESNESEQNGDSGQMQGQDGQNSQGGQGNQSGQGQNGGLFSFPGMN